MTQQRDDAGRNRGGRRYGDQSSRGGPAGGRFGNNDRNRGDNRRGPPRSARTGETSSRGEQRADEPPTMLELPMAKTSRQVAYGTLLAAVNSDEFVTDHLERSFAQSDLPSIERRLATELTFGVVRRKATLDEILEKSVTRPRQNVEPALWMLLRLGVYQLALCDGIPVHAACAETVELARWLDRPDWVPFANGVLRGISRLIVPVRVREPSPTVLPTTDNRFRQLAEPIFADPAQQPLVYVAKAFSLPLWLVERWSSRFDFAELCRLGFWFNTPSPLCLRVNRLRTNRDAVLAAFAEAGIAARPGELPTSIWLEMANGRRQPPDASEANRDSMPRFDADSPSVSSVESDAESESAAVGELNAFGESDTFSESDASGASRPPLAESRRIDRLPGFNEGWFVVQDESAQRAAELLAPQPGETVLDLCSAPGTKTTHLAELMRNEGRIIATDTGEQRLQRVAENCRRLGISIVETQLISQEGSDIPEGPFDAILIDAPCSNTGVLGKRPDARWRIQEDDLEELSRIQLRLLLAAANRLRPGGRIVYSTCSIEPEENAAVLEAASHLRTKLQLEVMHELIPGRPADGGFQSLLRSSS